MATVFWGFLVLTPTQKRLWSFSPAHTWALLLLQLLLPPTMASPTGHRINLTRVVSPKVSGSLSLPREQGSGAPQPDVAVKGEGCPLTGDVSRTKAGGEPTRAGGKPWLLPGPRSSFGAAGSLV